MGARLPRFYAGTQVFGKAPFSVEDRGFPSCYFVSFVVYGSSHPSLANFPPRVANLSMRVLSRFMASATDAAQFPAPSLPEIAFLGRSNVGKSSVINSLVGDKVARTSSTPGRTRAINFFEIRWPGKPRPELIFADLPGYGYAKISREISQEWPKFIEPYLNERPTLCLSIVLVDSNVPPQKATASCSTSSPPPTANSCSSPPRVTASPTTS